MLPKAVTDYLASHRQDHLAKLMEFIRFASVANTEPQQCQACAEWLVAHLRGLGMTARVEECPGRPNVIGSLHVSDRAPTVLIYGHYDVQPADPLDEWRTSPFEPVVQDGNLCARGSSDDKGQLFAHLAAVEAWQRAGGGVPVNVKVLVEGQEEIGSPHMEEFLTAHAKELSADAVVISDSEFFARGLPSITYALRGLAYVEVIFHGPRADIHSGINGGAVTNPVNALARLVAAMHDENGRVTLPGYYDDVVPLSAAEREEWSKLPVDDAAYAASLGVDGLGAGERGFSVLERRWARPTLDCNGILGGYTGPGAKTIIPSQASVKISMRLVSDQRPEKALAGLERFVAEHTPPGIRAELKVNAGARPVMLAQHSPAMEAARAALEEAFSAPAAMIRCGASVPITELFQRLLGVDPVLMGFGLPDDGLHSPNERFALDQLWGGMAASAAFLKNLRESLTTAS